MCIRDSNNLKKITLASLARDINNLDLRRNVDGASTAGVKTLAALLLTLESLMEIKSHKMLPESLRQARI